MKAELTKDECISLCGYIEINLFDYIREDSDVDSIEWLVNMAHVYEKAKAVAESA